ncbi:MAG: hypothetical protein JXL81_11650 [Deltaproteobacteria bacterium]|nr:hypothetical protein [Deltaproteobacteria bacterium]
MYDICIKKSVKGETILSLKENANLKDGEQIIGYAKAVDTGKSTYFCKDKGLILSPGDVVFLNGVDGWVEIVEFNRKKTEKKDTTPDNRSGIRLYNEGVSLYRKHSYKSAIDTFKNCYNTGAYKMQSAYLISLCQQKLGVDVTIPEGMEDRIESCGVIFIASNMVCKLINDGYQAALTGESSVLTIVNSSMYDIRVVTMMGSFIINAWRKEQGRTVPLTDTSINPNPSHSDQFIISLVKDAPSLPPFPLPVDGLPSAIEHSPKQEQSLKKAVNLKRPGIPERPVKRSEFVNKLIQGKWLLGFYVAYLLGFGGLMLLGELGVLNNAGDNLPVSFVIAIILAVIGLIGSTVSAYFHAENLYRDGGRWGLFVFLFAFIAPLVLVVMPENRNR